MCASQFGCDVGKFSNTPLGIMSTKLWDVSRPVSFWGIVRRPTVARDAMLPGFPTERLTDELLSWLAV